MTGIPDFIRRLATLAVACSVAGCGVGEASIDTGDFAAAPLRVDAVPVAVSDLYATYHATTTLAADRSASVPARVPGEVVAVLVEEGDYVVQGQVLARLDGERLKLRMLKSDADLAQRSSEFERYRRLHEQGLASNAAYDSLQADVTELRATHDIDRLNYSYAEIRAPITGVVTARTIRLGQHVQSGDIAFQISDTSRLVAHIPVPQAGYANIASGQDVLLDVPASVHSHVVTSVARISPTVDPARGSLHATAYVDNTNGGLAPGMFTRATIRTGHHAGALTVPPAALVEENGQNVVYVVRAGVVERREVRTGLADPDRVEIVDGIAAGDIVVRNAPATLRDGTRVALRHGG